MKTAKQIMVAEKIGKVAPSASDNTCITKLLWCIETFEQHEAIMIDKWAHDVHAELNAVVAQLRTLDDQTGCMLCGKVASLAEIHVPQEIVEIVNSVQQRYAKIADSIDAASGSVHMTLPGLKLFCVEWSRQLRQ